MAMNVVIFTQNLELTERIDDYVRRKVAKFDRMLKDIDETRIDLSHAKSARSASDRLVAQITVRGKGFILRSEERTDDIFSSFDAAMEKVLRQIERFKGKRSRSRSSYADHIEALQREDSALR